MKESLRRYSLLALGIVIMAIGIVTIIKAQLGTSPISSLPYVMSIDFSSFSYGEFTLCWNILLVLAQILILKKDFKMINWLQIPISVLFAFSIDVISSLLGWITPSGYLSSIAIFLFGMLMLAAGVTLTVVSNTVMNCAEAFVQAVTVKTGWKFSTTKIAFDIALVILSMAISWVLLGSIEGVGIGTIVAAICTGLIVKLLMGTIATPLGRWCASES